MECEEKSRLIMAFDDAVRVYRDTVRELTERLGTTPKAHYQKLLLRSEGARMECEKARLALESHTAIHNC